MCAAAAGCGGGTSFHGNVFRNDETSYSVGEPGASFERVSVENHNDLAWDNGRGAIIQVNSSCDPALDIPLVALTNQLLIGFTERDVKEQNVVPMAGREALRTHGVAKLDGVPRELLLTVLKKNGCVFDFALAAPEGASFAAASQSYEKVLSGFASDGKRRP